MSDHRTPRFDPARHHRRSIRKPTHDYASPGLYFVTFCTHHRSSSFGTIKEGQVQLNDLGRIAHDHWNGIPGHYGHVEVHAFTIMPDHIHGIIELTDFPRTHRPSPSTGARPLGPMPGSLGAVVGSYRAGVVREMNRVLAQRTADLWQRGYHDIIIQNGVMLERIVRYIRRHPTMVLPDH